MSWELVSVRNEMVNIFTRVRWCHDNIESSTLPWWDTWDGAMKLKIKKVIKGTIQQIDSKAKDVKVKTSGNKHEHEPYNLVRRPQ